MSTNVEPVVAQGEKSIFFIFLPKIFIVSQETWWDFYLKMFFKPAKNSQIRYGPTSGQKHAKFSDQYPTILPSALSASQ